MRISKIIYLALIAIVLAFATLPELAEAKRSGGGSRSRSSGRSSSGRHYSGRSGSTGGGSVFRRSKYTYYEGVILFPVVGGGYRNGYGRECPNGCAVNGRCGTVE